MYISFLANKIIFLFQFEYKGRLDKNSIPLNAQNLKNKKNYLFRINN